MAKEFSKKWLIELAERTGYSFWEWLEYYLNRAENRKKKTN